VVENVAAIERVLAVMARLRDPDSGCPWDVQQDFDSIAPHTVEEAYEVADAIARGDHAGLRDELGDLLLQVVFHAQMAKEAGLFDFDDVAAGLENKLLHRHPHVFGELADQPDVDVAEIWETQKRAERNATGEESALDAVTHGLPALLRAQKLQKRAARVGFDWAEAAPVFDKLAEEVAELQAAHNAGDSAAVGEELGDLLFAAVNLARHLEVDAETALCAATGKFDRRFRYIETQLRTEGRRMRDCTLAELDQIWEQAKRGERDAPT
jgi:MazG family protein